MDLLMGSDGCGPGDTVYLEIRTSSDNGRSLLIIHAPKRNMGDILPILYPNREKNQEETQNACVLKLSPVSSTISTQTWSLHA